MVLSTIHVSQAHILEKQSRRRTADSTGSPKWVDSKNPLSGFFYVRINVANAEFSYTYSVKCDESSARPAGSMEVLDVVWFTHNSKSGQYSSAKVHRSVSVNVDGTVTVNGSSIPDLRYEVIEGR